MGENPDKVILTRVLSVVQIVASRGAYTQDDLTTLENLYYEGRSDVQREIKEALNIEDS